MWGFRLRKWYLDLTTDGGDAVIAYWAEVSLGAFSVTATSVLTAVGGAGETTAGAESCGQPVEDGGGVSFASARHGMRGRWSGDVRGESCVLLRNEHGEIVWRPAMLCADVVVECARGRIEGRGYVELIEMTVVPWRLPFEALRWGRAVCGGRGCTWIDWRGGMKKSWVADERGVREGASVSDDRVAWEGEDVGLVPERVLREGPIGPTVLSRVPGLSAVLPRVFLSTHECKRVCRAEWRRGGERVDGWAIAETVSFGGAGE